MSEIDPVNDDILAEIASDLTYAEQMESEFHYEAGEKAIAVRRWNEDGSLGDVLGFIKFEESP